MNADYAGCWNRYTVAQIVQEEEVDLPRSASEPFVASLTELVYAQCGASSFSPLLV